MGEVLIRKSILFFRSCSNFIKKRNKAKIKKKRQPPRTQKVRKTIKADKHKRTSLRSLLIATSL